MEDSNKIISNYICRAIYDTGHVMELKNLEALSSAVIPTKGTFRVGDFVNFDFVYTEKERTGFTETTIFVIKKLFYKRLVVNSSAANAYYLVVSLPGDTVEYVYSTEGFSLVDVKSDPLGIAVAKVKERRLSTRI